MSEIESRFVHHGIWVDISRGNVMGRTITTDTRTGTIVVAILAVLCSLATAHLWHLITFGIHQYHADGKPSDALFRQQQAILRTFPQPSALVAEFAKLYWSWKPSNTHSPATRMIPLASFAIIFTAATAAAGIFSSYVVDTTNLLVVTESPFCGPVDTSDNDDAYTGLNRNYTPLVRSLAAPLVQDCYQDVSSTSPRCRIYSKPRIPFNVTRENCPWDSSMCLKMDSPAVIMDSGLLDMNDAFGLNLMSSDRVHFRKKTSCAILPLENRTTLIPATEYPGSPRAPLPEEELLVFSYATFPGAGDWSNATFVLSLTTSNVTTDHFIVRKIPSYKDPYWAYYHSPLIPDQGITRNDADIVFKWIVKNRIAYDNPVNDPVFSAHKEYTAFDVTSGSNLTYYYHDFPGTVIGCAQQYQFCLKKDNCTALNYLPHNITAIEFPNASSLQLAVLQLLVDSSMLFDIQAANTLFADKLLRIGGYINSLPDDQWVKEIIGWESNTWASLQVAIEKYATGAKSIDLFADSYVKSPKTDGEKALCTKQRMKKSGGFVNINVFALSFICAFSVFIFTLDIVLLRFLIYLSRFRRTQHLGPRIERWIQDGVLQLQRRAFESSRQGTWRSLDKEVPITVRRETLEDLPSGNFSDYYKVNGKGEALDEVRPVDEKKQTSLEE